MIPETITIPTNYLLIGGAIGVALFLVSRSYVNYVKRIHASLIQEGIRMHDENKNLEFQVRKLSQIVEHDFEITERKDENGDPIFQLRKRVENT